MASCVSVWQPVSAMGSGVAILALLLGAAAAPACGGDADRSDTTALSLPEDSSPGTDGPQSPDSGVGTAHGSHGGSTGSALPGESTPTDPDSGVPQSQQPVTSGGPDTESGAPETESASDTPDAFPNCPEACRALCEALEHDAFETREDAGDVVCVVRSGFACGRVQDSRSRLLFPGVLAPCAEADATCTLNAEPEEPGAWHYRCRAALPCTATYACIGDEEDTLAFGCEERVPRAIPCAASLGLPGEATEPARCNAVRGACESPEGAWCDGDAFLCAEGLTCDTSLVQDGPPGAGRCVDRQATWARCDAERACAGDAACLGILPEPGAHCARFCATRADCTLADDVNTEPVCAEVDGARLCRMPCATASDCPGELVCVGENGERFCV